MSPHTNIALIPKVKGVNNMTLFRPVSLCNVVYKISAKMVANRLKPVLPHVISESQSTFVPGRLISDNVIAAFKVESFFEN